MFDYLYTQRKIIALRNEKGSYNSLIASILTKAIIALRNEKGSYNNTVNGATINGIIALRNEKGSYNLFTIKR